MTNYHLPSYHFAKISYRYSTFAKAFSEKEPHLNHVLKLSEITPEHWIAQKSRRQLMEYYTSHKYLDKAQTLIDSIKVDNGNNSYLKALMAIAKKHEHEIKEYGQRSFEQAQLAGDRTLSLASAKLLCNQEINCDFYSQYINENTNVY